MRYRRHVEKHFTASETVRDIVIGMADGLTVPFALAAGLSGAVADPRIIITAGLAEVAAGAIAMGLGGYLAARTDAEHFASERAREYREVKEMPEEEAEEVADVFRSYGLDAPTVSVVVNAIRADDKRWVDFMMRFELGLEEPDPKRARNSALTIALSYIAGGMVPLAPYFVFPTVHGALLASVGRHPPRPARLRLRQGAVHHDPAVPQRVADRRRRRAGGDRRVRDREGDRGIGGGHGSDYFFAGPFRALGQHVRELHGDAAARPCSGGRPP